MSTLPEIVSWSRENFRYIYTVCSRVAWNKNTLLFDDILLYYDRALIDNYYISGSEKQND